jgi:hypothetical protein
MTEWQVASKEIAELRQNSELERLSNNFFPNECDMWHIR